MITFRAAKIRLPHAIWIQLFNEKKCEFFFVKNQISQVTNLIKCTSWHDVPLALTWSNGHGFPDDTSNCTIWHEAGISEISTSHNSLLVDLKKQYSSFAKLKPTFEHFSSYSKFVDIVQTKHRITTPEKDIYRLQSTLKKVL